MTRKSVAQKVCNVDGCVERYRCSGYCSKHYQRIKTKGTLDVKANYGTGNTPEIKFWSKVLLTSNPDKCWVWTGHAPNQYGMVTRKGKSLLAHRYAWFLVKGTWPENYLCHKCRNKLCVNPNHLYDGTPMDNMRDRETDGNTVKGEIHPKAILTNEQVVEIKKLLTIPIKGRDIARQFNVGEKVVTDIKIGRCWKHI